MARIRIPLPDTFHFETSIVLRISDINYGGHLGNDSVLSLIHEARFRFFNHLGYADELSIDGLGTIQADVAIAYKGGAFHGDEISIALAVTEIGRKSFDIVYRLSRGEQEIARAKTGIAMFDYDTKSVANLPEAFLKKIQF